MNKIRSKLLSKEQGQERAAPMSTLRELKKCGKVESKGAIAGKRNAKDKKFGFGGKKRHLKKNDKNSTDDVSGFKPFNKGGAGGKFGGKPGGNGGKKLGKGANKRPGK